MHIHLYSESTSIILRLSLSKINLKDGEIELKAQEKETSIFNRHLDEIIYFFQSTEYNVVIIEDLDRFNTADIYLKLRELNQLINDSKEIGRHIVFIYAVKDDVFKDTQRAKFFDYISTVIPFINPSNSKDKLKEELRIRGYEDIPDDDLEEIAFLSMTCVCSAILPMSISNTATDYALWHKLH